MIADTTDLTSANDDLVAVFQAVRSTEKTGKAGICPQ
jgi:hypothetical protein